MSINNVSYTYLSKLVNHINNPNKTLGTLVEEIPCDLGRSYEGYKRGGILEGAEKLRKEVMSAAVWLFGIPAFNKLGTHICEKYLNIPMDVDYSKDVINNTANYLTGNAINDKNLDVSDLAKYADKYIGQNPKELAKKMTRAKQVTLLSALALNCVLMGVVLPKFNRAITNKKLKEQKAKQYNPNIPKMDEFIGNTKKSKNQPAFKGRGLALNLGNAIDYVTYNIENNNRFRLISTDLPMIGGRVATSSNKFEGLEYIIIDGGSIYFYNFCSQNVQKLLRNITSTPDINPIVAQNLASYDSSIISDAISKLKEGSLPLEQLFEDKNIVKEIYKEATYGKYGKINKFVSDEQLKEIDANINSFLKEIKKRAFKDGKLDENLFKEQVRKINNKNAGFLAMGLFVSILGLAVFIPKLAFWITKKLTGRNEFTGISDYSDLDKKKA